MNEEKKKWFQSLPTWLKIVIELVVLAASILWFICSVASCGNTKVLIRNADRSTVSQTGSDIEVSISADMDSLTFSTYKKEKQSTK